MNSVNNYMILRKDPGHQNGGQLAIWFQVCKTWYKELCSVVPWLLTYKNYKITSRYLFQAAMLVILMLLGSNRKLVVYRGREGGLGERKVWRLILVKILNLLFKLYSDGADSKEGYLTEQFYIIVLYLNPLYLLLYFKLWKFFRNCSKYLKFIH